MKRQTVIKKNFGGILLPDGIIKLLPNMDGAQLKTFIYLSSCGGAVSDDAAKTLGISPEEFEAALAFCRGTGFFVAEDAPAPQTRTPSFQSYDSETLSGAIREEPEFSLLVNEIGRIIGKVMNKNDINLLFNLYDYEGLSSEYICAVANYAVRRSKGNMSYIVRTSLSIRDEGITSYNQLEEYIAHREKSESGKARLWHIMGFGDRAPSTREKAYLTKWFDEYAMSEELIMAAYEITVDAIGSPKLNYMSKILDDWFTNGYTTPEQANASRTNKKPAAANSNSSFDINELYTTAVKKGMEE